jgi:hypothetical protein
LPTHGPYELDTVVYSSAINGRVLASFLLTLDDELPSYKNSLSAYFKGSTAIHGALREFEFGDLALCLALAVGPGHGIKTAGAAARINLLARIRNLPARIRKWSPGRLTLSCKSTTEC